MTGHFEFAAGATAVQRSAVRVFMLRLWDEWNGTAPVMVVRGRVWFAPIGDEL